MQDLSNLWTQDHRRLAGLFAIKYQYIGNKTCKKWKSLLLQCCLLSFTFNYICWATHSKGF